jgi:hypothetical protein
VNAGTGQQTVGWREWVSFPDVGVQWIKAKIDTGARTSSLHAHGVVLDESGDTTWAEFDIHPWQRSHEDVVRCRAPVLERRRVRSSSGHEAVRPVVELTIELAGRQLPIEVTLARRDSMGFRLLIGRQALRPHFLVDSGRSYLGGRPPKEIRRVNRGRGQR